MNQIKIGKFIAECRKEQNLTQLELAEKLNITDRAVSKWETGRSMPDSSIMLELCGILKITVTDLLNGERVEDNRPDITEAHLLQAIKEKQEADKRLLRIEIFIGILATVILLASTIISAYVQMPDWAKFALIGSAAVIAIPSFILCVKIEQVAGYYKCAHCGHTYVPGFGSVYGAMHRNRTRYMKCPHCGKWSWQKKVLERNPDQPISIQNPTDPE